MNTHDTTLLKIVIVGLLAGITQQQERVRADDKIARAQITLHGDSGIVKLTSSIFAPRQIGRDVRITSGPLDVLPSWSPQGELFAFLAARPNGGAWERTRRIRHHWMLFVSDPRVEKPNERRVTELPVIHFQWAPDGKSLLVVSGAEDERNVDAVELVSTAIYRVDLSSGKTNRLTPLKGRCLYPAWNPASDAFVYVSRTRTAAALRWHNLSTGRSNTLVENVDPHSAPLWSSNGHTIAFARLGKKPGERNVWLANPASRAVRALTDETQDQRPLDWSRDNRRLLMTRGSALQMADIGTGEAQHLHPECNSIVDAKCTTDEGTVLLYVANPVRESSPFMYSRRAVQAHGVTCETKRKWGKRSEFGFSLLDSSPSLVDATRDAVMEDYRRLQGMWELDAEQVSGAELKRNINKVPRVRVSGFQLIEDARPKGMRRTNRGHLGSFIVLPSAEAGRPNRARVITVEWSGNVNGFPTTEERIHLSAIYKFHKDKLVLGHFSKQPTVFPVTFDDAEVGQFRFVKQPANK